MASQFKESGLTTRSGDQIYELERDGRTYLVRSHRDRGAHIFNFCNSALDNGLNYENNRIVLPEDKNSFYHDPISHRTVLYIPKINGQDMKRYSQEIVVTDRPSLLPQQVFFQMVRDISTALDSFHQVGYCYLDTRPSNILNDNGRFSITDLGSVSLTSESPYNYMYTEKLCFTYMLKFFLVYFSIAQKLQYQPSDTNFIDLYFNTPKWDYEYGGGMQQLLNITVTESLGQQVTEVFTNFESNHQDTDFYSFGERLIKQIQEIPQAN